MNENLDIYSLCSKYVNKGFPEQEIDNIAELCEIPVSPHKTNSYVMNKILDKILYSTTGTISGGVAGYFVSLLFPETNSSIFVAIGGLGGLIYGLRFESNNDLDYLVPQMGKIQREEKFVKLSESKAKEYINQ